MAPPVSVPGAGRPRAARQTSAATTVGVRRAACSITSGTTCSAKWHGREVAAAHLPQLGRPRGAFLGVAELLPQPAPGVEPASRGRVHRGRDVALEDQPAAPAARIRVGDRGQEGHGVGVAGLPVEVLHRAHLRDLAQVHHAHPVADVLDDREVVTDEQVRQVVVLPQVQEQVEDLALDGDVERGDRLVAGR